MTNHIRSSHSSLAALLLAGMPLACAPDPLAGTTLPSEDGAAVTQSSTGGITPRDAAQPGAGGTGGGVNFTGGTTVMPVDAAQPGAGGAGGSAISTSPVQLDILVMVDNSPSMDPKQNSLAEKFPLLIQQLKQLPGGLPDVHIGVISSDMGSGSEPVGANCQRVLGDRGLLYGNDPNNPLASVAPTADPALGGHPQANGCGLASGQRWISDIANPIGAGRIANYDGQIEDVFACLAQAVGSSGCGFEHQLQSLRVALNPDYPNNPNQAKDPNYANLINPENTGFVRPNAYLGIVLVTDEDDCSADPDDRINDGMFLETQQIPTETASLRCAARGHVCNGQPIPGYSDPSIGYQPPNPLPAPNVGFTTAFTNCAAKDQLDPNYPDQKYLPLIRVQDMIDSINTVTAWVVDANGNYVYDSNGNHEWVQKSHDKILVAGIFGWPVGGDLTGVNYQIGKDSTSLPVEQQTLWDYLPICEIPTINSSDGNIYKAYGGLRLKAFVDAFGDNGAVYSICDADFTAAMQGFGTKLSDKLAAAMSH